MSNTFINRSSPRKNRPGELLKMLRLRSGLSPTQLARLLGFKNARMIQLWEGDYAFPGPKHLKDLIELYLERSQFISGQEIQEARQLWESVQASYYSSSQKFKIYPPFDEGWFNGAIPSSNPHAPATIPAVSGLPVSPGSFIGREKQLKELSNLIQRPGICLITLVGPAGTGKTRLALQAAPLLAQHLQLDIIWIDLTAINQPELFLRTLAQALKIKGLPEASLYESLQKVLVSQPRLLVLDNFEHLLPAAPQLAGLLKDVINLRALVTSREPLHLYGEQQYFVPPLTLPGAAEVSFDQYLELPDSLKRFEAVRLLEERASLVRPDFIIKPENASAIAEICRRLEGLPLAIELAAARLTTVSPREMLDQMKQSPLLSLLDNGPVDRPARHQSLKWSLDWSYTLLSEIEQKFFRQLGVFSGGWRVEAAEAIWREESELPGNQLLSSDISDNSVNPGLAQQVANDRLFSLAAHNLIQTEPEGRFRMLEILREYTLACLEEAGELEDMRSRHARYFLKLAEQIQQLLYGKEQDQAYGRLEEELPNLRTAMQWVIVTGQADMAARLAKALWRFSWVHGHYNEGLDWLEATLALNRTLVPAVQVELLHAQGILNYALGYYEKSYEINLQCLQLNRELNDLAGCARSLNNLGAAASNLGRPAEAKAYYENSLDLHRQTQDRWSTAFVLANLGFIAMNEMNYQTARDYCQQALALFDELGDKLGGRGRVLNYLGAVAYKMKDYQQAAEYQKESLSLRHQIGDKAAMTECLDRLAAIAATCKRPQLAAQLFGAAEQLRESIGAPIPYNLLEDYEHDLEQARQQLDLTGFQVNWLKGRNLSLEEAIAAALDV